MAETDPLSNVRRVIVVSNVLPVTITQNPRSGKWNVEFDTAPLYEDGPIYTGIANCTPNAIFVGVPPVNVPMKDRNAVAEALARKNCYPVYVPAREASLHYQGMCKSILWPLFHNVIDLYNDVQIQAVLTKGELERSATPQEEGGAWYPARSFNPQEIEVLWPAHLDFVLKFRSVILSLYGEGDLIWIHDYHLIMLVGPLRRLLPPVG
jgi:trehalose-6-phosphate synthase